MLSYAEELARVAAAEPVAPRPVFLPPARVRKVCGRRSLDLLGRMAHRAEHALAASLKRATEAWDQADAFSVIDGGLEAQIAATRRRLAAAAAPSATAARRAVALEGLLAVDLSVALVRVFERRLAALLRLRLRSTTPDLLARGASLPGPRSRASRGRGGLAMTRARWLVGGLIGAGALVVAAEALPAYVAGRLVVGVVAVFVLVGVLAVGLASLARARRYIERELGALRAEPPGGALYLERRRQALALRRRNVAPDLDVLADATAAEEAERGYTGKYLVATTVLIGLVGTFGGLMETLARVAPALKGDLRAPRVPRARWR